MHRGIDPYTRSALGILALLGAILLAFYPWRKTPSKPLGAQRKRMAIALIGVGLGTLYLPMVTLNAPVMNKTRWSFVDIASAVYAGALPVPRGHFDEAMVEIALIYLLTLLALQALYLPGQPKVLTFLST